MVFEASDAAGGGFFGALGIGVVTSDAFAVGVTAVPNPVDDADWDGWMWHQFVSVHTITATIADGVNAQGVYARVPIDTKAMRKIPLNETVFLSLQVAEAISATMEVFADSRMLLKLP